MTDEQIKALSAYEGHNPEDEAKIGRAIVRNVLLEKRIAELEKLIPLVKEVMSNHRDPQSGEYNECEKSPCMWCDLAQKAIDAARKED